MNIVERLRQHALPDPHDEREVMHAPLLKEAADLIERQAERIKQLVELCRLQHVALIELSPCMYKECQQVQKETQDHAIAAFNKFEGGE